MFKDYYAILEIDANANINAIKSAFKRQAIKWHPDKNPGQDTTARMQDINEAYLFLKDNEARDRYNREYQRFKQYQREQEQSQKNAEKKKPVFEEEEGKNETSDYIVNDDLLKKWMENARKQAVDLAKQTIEEFRGISSAGIRTFTNEISWRIIRFLILIIIGGIILVIVSKMLSENDVAYDIKKIEKTAQVEANNESEEASNNQIEVLTKRKLKSEQYYFYDAVENSGEIQKGKRTSTGSFIVYNDKGTITERRSYGVDGNISSIDINNEKGERIESYSYNSDGKLNYKSTYEYDTHGNEIEQKGYKNSVLVHKQTHKFKYDKKGNKIENRTYNLDGSLWFKTIYQYDNNGNNIEEISYNPDGSLNTKLDRKYDEKDSLIEFKWFTYDGSLVAKNINKYDEKGNLIEEIGYGRGGIFDGTKIYRYNNEGIKVEEQDYRPNGKLERVYNYDNNGNSIGNKEYREDGSILSNINYMRFYDNQGNWVKSYQYENDKLGSICERELVYY